MAPGTAEEKKYCRLNFTNLTRTLCLQTVLFTYNMIKISSQFAKTFARTGCNHSKGTANHTWNIPAQSKISAFSLFRLRGLYTTASTWISTMGWERRAWKFLWSLQLWGLCFQSYVWVIKISLRGNGIHHTTMLRASSSQHLWS